jgi:hypothetical protein
VPVDEDVAALEAALFSSTKVLATWRYAMACSASDVSGACWRREMAAPRLAWGLLNVGIPVSSNSMRRSLEQGRAARRCSSAHH